MLHTKKNFLKSALAVFCMVSMLLFSSYNGLTTVYAASGYEYVLLTKYTKTMKIGDEYYLTAITSTGKKPKFSSSDSTVASVNTYGKITAKKAGSEKRKIGSGKLAEEKSAEEKPKRKRTGKTEAAGVKEAEETVNRKAKRSRKAKTAKA